MQFNIMNKLKEFEGETFFTKRKIPYKYVVYGDYILINDNPKRRITKSALEKALTIKNPTPAKIEEENIWGPSYVYGIITDNRIV